MTILTKLSRIIGVLAACMVLAGCSAIKLGYSNLPQVSYWWLDAYLDFTEDQSPRVRDALAQLHLWHRQQELPRFAQLLTQAERLAGGDIAPQQACGLYDGLRQRLAAARAQAEPPMVAVALTLTPQQLRHVAQRSERNNAEFRRDWLALSPAALRDKRFKQLEDRAEMVYGTLEAPQRETLRQAVAKSVFDPRGMLAERERGQADLQRTLSAMQAPGLPAAEATRLMQGFLDRLQLSPDAAWNRHQQTLLQEGCAMAAAVHNAATPAQRSNTVRRMRAYQRDIADLAAP
jgi:hypothetical protein